MARWWLAATAVGGLAAAAAAQGGGSAAADDRPKELPAQGTPLPAYPPYPGASAVPAPTAPAPGPGGAQPYPLPGQGYGFGGNTFGGSGFGTGGYATGPAGPYAPNVFNRAVQPLNPYLNLLQATNPAVNYFYRVRPGLPAGLGPVGVGGPPVFGTSPLRTGFLPQTAAPALTSYALPPAGQPIVLQPSGNYRVVYGSRFGPSAGGFPGVGGPSAGGGGRPFAPAAQSRSTTPVGSAFPR